VNKRCYYVVLCSLSPAHYAKCYTGQSWNSRKSSSRKLGEIELAAGLMQTVPDQGEARSLLRKLSYRFGGLR
jgi:hypothetical protein